MLIKNSSLSKTGSYFASLEADIDKVIATPNLITDTLGGFDEDAVKTKYGIAPTAMKAVLANGNSLGLGYKQARANKDDINNFISLFGLGEVSDEIIA